jgi:LCP family protein required for cell wall assembly
MIVTVNPKTHDILLTSIPRDYYVQLHGTTGLKDKLTHAGIYGVDMSVSTLEDLFDIDINYYVRVNFTTLIQVVDTIDGIDVESDKSFTAYTDNSVYVKKGSNHFNGKQALAYSRERYAYQEGDRHRVQNQQDVITAIMNKMLSSKTLITKYNSILNTLDGSFQTNMKTSSLTSLIKKQIDTMPSWNITSQSVNGTDSSNVTYSYPGQKLYVMVPDMSTVESAKTKITEVYEKK